MEGLREILVVIERGAEQYPEIDRAIELAEASGARVHLLVREYHAVLYWHYIFGKRGDKMSQQAYEREAQSWVDEQVRALVDQGIDATGEARWTRHMYTAIQDKVAEIEPDLLIKGAHDTATSEERSFYDPIDWKLMRHCCVPVLLIKYQTRASQGTVLCAVNPAHPDAAHQSLDHRIMALGETMADHLGRPLHVFSCFHSPAEQVAPPIALEAGVYDDYLEELRSEHNDCLDRFLAHYNLPETNIHRLEGAPSLQLPELAEELPAAMVVMGVVSRSALPEILVGHTAERVLDRLYCDILVVKPEDAAES